MYKIHLRTSNTSLSCVMGRAFDFIILPSFSLRNFKECGIFFWSGRELWTLSRVLYPPKVPNFAWQTWRVATYQLRTVLYCKMQNVNMLNLKVHYYVDKSLPLLPILSHTNSVHIHTSYFFKTDFNISLPPSARYSRWYYS